MAKARETFEKKEKEKRRLKQRQDKQEKMQDRKTNAKSGKSLEDMMAYIDENGNISSVPPDPRKKKTFKVEDMQTGVPKYEPSENDSIRSGIVAFFNEDKGFGFINDAKTGERFFVHVSQTTERLVENNKVSFEVEAGDRGLSAVSVKKLT